MNIVLLNPKLNTWSPNVYAPLGLAYIAAALEKEHYHVEIIDLNSKRMADKKLQERLVDADVIGITGLITEYSEVVRLVQLSKEFNRKAQVILGGPLATTHATNLLNACYADFVVIGEGERTIVRLLKTLEVKGDLSLVKGIAYRDGSQIKITPEAELVTNLDDIEFPARHLLDMKNYTTHHFKAFGMKGVKNLKSVTMITSRGCPFHCSYCFKQVGGLQWRGRSPENIFAEMKQLHEKYGFNGFVFNDDTFVVNKKRALKFCQLLIDSKLNFSWYCNARVDLMSEDLIEIMAESGCKGIAYGVESGNQKVIDLIKKAITLEQVERIARLTKKYGIHVTGYFMLGILGDSKETIRQTLEFARKLDLDFYGFGMCSPIHGTPMYEQALEKGIMAQQQLQDWSFYAPINMTNDCTSKELEEFNKEAFREFTIQKRYGKHYLWNPVLWWDGFKSLVFLMGKRNFTPLVKKAWSVIIPQRTKDELA